MFYAVRGMYSKIHFRRYIVMFGGRSGKKEHEFLRQGRCFGLGIINNNKNCYLPKFPI